jgi:putative Ca2+/H+ antiporter (TMEM165/GDT1 family)
MRELMVIFSTVFLAELGDKTQLATLLFASDGKSSHWPVFFAAASALVLSTAIAVALGTVAERYLTMLPLKLIAGLGFIAVGVWTVASHLRGA